jgi:hypothetical protein
MINCLGWREYPRGFKVIRLCQDEALSLFSDTKVRKLPWISRRMIRDLEGARGTHTRNWLVWSYSSRYYQWFLNPSRQEKEACRTQFSCGMLRFPQPHFRFVPLNPTMGWALLSFPSTARNACITRDILYTVKKFFIDYLIGRLV